MSDDDKIIDTIKRYDELLVTCQECGGLREILAALRSNGMDVIELPEPDYGPDREGDYEWTTQMGTVSTGNGQVWDQDYEIDPDNAEEHAAAILAAAAKARDVTAHD